MGLRDHICIPRPFLVDVDVLIDGHKNHTTYGIVKRDTQDRAYIEQLCSKVELCIIKESSNAEHFSLHYERNQTFKN